MKIIIVAGEPSGDQLAAGFVRKLKEYYPNAQIEGIAGEKMQSNGCKSLYNMQILSVMGVVEVIKSLPKILKVRYGLLKYLKKDLPDIYIGVDAPDFNLPIEKKMRLLGVKTIHYVSPSVWAWREGRLKTIKKATNVVLSILPFEEAYYANHNHKAIFVGHPLANKIPQKVDCTEKKSIFNFCERDYVVGILPGSRIQEVIRLLPPFLEAAILLQKKIPDIKFILPLADEAMYDCLESYEHLLKQISIKVICKNSHDAIAACDSVMVASGTATLEVMLYKKPMLMAYKLNKFNFFLAKIFIKIKRFSLPNILANDDLICELIQDSVTPENIFNEMMKIYSDHNYRNHMISKFILMHKSMDLDSDKLAFNVVHDMLNGRYE